MTICGLDFGTSNSTIGVLFERTPTMVPLEQDAAGNWQTTLPSALFFGFEENEISFGRHAIARYTQGESGRLMRSMKSLLGSSFMGDTTQVKNRFYSFDEIIGFFMGSLKQQAEAHLGDHAAALDSVVLGRPVFFNDDDAALDRAAQDHLEQIARIAGFNNVSFQFEPIAAALDYEQRVQTEELALIVDIGGGTSDFTLVRLSPQRRDSHDRESDFLANHGVHIGGTDFDRRLSIAGVMPQLGFGMPMADRPTLNMPGHYYHDLATWHKIHLLYSRDVLRELREFRVNVSDKWRLDRLIKLLQNRNGHRLAALVEQAKIDLSTQPETTVSLSSLFEEDEASIDDCRLTQSLLQASLQRDVEKIFLALDETLLQAGVAHAAIDTVFTTGGSTALPLVAACIERTFPDATHIAGDLYTSVGSGLLTEAIRRYR